MNALLSKVIESKEMAIVMFVEVRRFINENIVEAIRANINEFSIEVITDFRV
jgi:hypothetical protein